MYTRAHRLHRSRDDEAQLAASQDRLKEELESSRCEQAATLVHVRDLEHHNKSLSEKVKTSQAAVRAPNGVLAWPAMPGMLHARARVCVCVCVCMFSLLLLLLGGGVESVLLAHGISKQRGTYADCRLPTAYA